MNKSVLIVLAVFYLGWFGSVFLAKTAWEFFSIVFALILIGYLLWKRRLTRFSFAAALIISAAGVIFDSIVANAGIMTVAGQKSMVIPVWLISIWLLYSFSMFELGPSLRWPVWLAAILGFIGGPLSYKSGEAFGVLTFSSPSTFWVYGLFWALYFPFVLKITKRFV